MDITLRVWRQRDAEDRGRFVDYKMAGVSGGASLLEVLDLVNEKLVAKGEPAIAFDHDCREGICGACSMTINGSPHGGFGGLTACQVHMYRFKDGDTITLEPFRAKPFTPIRDLVVDRSAFEKIQQAGGFISVRPGQAPDGNVMPIGRDVADRAMDAAMCIGCGACAASCPNGSAMLFVAAKVAQLNLLPQGQPERDRRALAMVDAMDDAGFGACSNHGECEAVCPKGVSLDFIAMLNVDFARAAAKRLLGIGVTS